MKQSGLAAQRTYNKLTTNLPRRVIYISYMRTLGGGTHLKTLRLRTRSKHMDDYQHYAIPSYFTYRIELNRGWPTYGLAQT